MAELQAYETPACPVCNSTSQVRLDPDKVQRWQDGDHVQNVWPEMSPDERELLITGTHPACWEKLFPPEADDDGYDDGSASLLDAASYRPPSDEALTSGSAWNQHVRETEGE